MINFTVVIIYSIVFVFGLLYFTYKSPLIRVGDLKPWVMPSALLIKISAGLLLFILHIQTYGVDELSHDGETFFKEGKYLNNVFFQSPGHYLQLLTGIGENTWLVEQYLSMTEYWSAGDLSIVNDSKNVIRVHSIIHFFSWNSVFVHLAVMCFLSLVGVRNLYLAFRDHVRIKKKILFWTILLVPSTIFWTSSIMKEPLMFLGISFLLRALLVREGVFKRVILTLSACIFLIGFKPYVFFCMLLAIFCAVIYRHFFSTRFIPALLTILTFTAIGIVMLENPRDTIVHYLTRKQFDFENVGKGGLHAKADSCFYYFQPKVYNKLTISGRKVVVNEPVDAHIIHFGSTKSPIPVQLQPTGDTLHITYFTQGCKSFIETTPINESFPQLMANIPEALANSYLRPYPNDPGSRLKYLSMIEVWILTIFLVLVLFRHRKIGRDQRAIVFGMITFALLLLLLIGWTTPVIGAIARYRFPAQLALVLAGLILIKPNFKLFVK